MKSIASLVMQPGVSPPQFSPYEADEATRVWELYTHGTIKEIYLRSDLIGAVIVLETASQHEAEAAIESLPMVRAGLLSATYLWLAPWPEMTRLLEEHNQPMPTWWPQP